MSLIGFDPDLVVKSIDNVQSAYKELIKAIATDMQGQFVNGMENMWACKEAISFFQTFKSTIDSFITDSNNTFQSVVESMNSAASGWAQQTGTSWSAKQFDRIDKNIDISCIKENIGGVRGVDPDAPDVAAKLTGIASSAVNALTNARSAVQNCGFIGGTSASSLISSLDKIKNSIESAVEQISSDCQQAIEITAQNYGTFEGNVSDAFAGTK